MQIMRAETFIPLSVLAGIRMVKKYDMYNNEEMKLLSYCTLCPRECGVNRFEGGTGYCGMDAGMNIASICIHRGEEPAISGPDGICNIFFAGCNLRCIYCQNHDISRPGTKFFRSPATLEETLDTIENMLSDRIRMIGFVSPSHVVPQVKAIIRGLNDRGFNPITVYNTNSYDKAEVIDSFEGLIDVWLPDYKYATSIISKEYSDASDYPDIALKALKRMYFQKGSVLSLDQAGRAEKGILIRHLVLPGHVDVSIKVLKSIAEDLSTGVSISLMSQYHPTPFVKDHPQLDRSLYSREYESVVKTMEELGFRNGWIQDMESFRNYNPDFSKEHPFG
jgi:putative pyruvate formate lyase activating enzyme